MPILLMNLLIGLAVGDIESVRRNAQLKRLAMQVVLHTELERKLPKLWLEKADKSELIEYPNNMCSKLGIFDIILRRWFCNPFNDECDFFKNISYLNENALNSFNIAGNMDMNFESSEEIMAEEMEKHRRKLRDITATLDQQHQMLRLIIQVCSSTYQFQYLESITTKIEITFNNSMNFRKWKLKPKRMMSMKVFHQMICDYHQLCLQRLQ